MILVIDQTSWRTIRYDRNADGTPRLMTPAGVLIHSDEGSRKGSLPWLTTHPDSGVSCHYYVCRDGDVFQLAEDTWRTWHAGPGSYDGLTDLNRTIGIECEHKQGGPPWTDEQLDALRLLCLQLIARWNIPESRMIAHRWTKRPASASTKYDPTDWIDVELKPWIAALYEPEWIALWSSAGVQWRPEREGWGIVQAWKRSHADRSFWGPALSEEETFSGRQLQLFERAIITWKEGSIKVYRGEF